MESQEKAGIIDKNDCAYVISKKKESIKNAQLTLIIFSKFIFYLSRIYFKYSVKSIGIKN